MFQISSVLKNNKKKKSRQVESKWLSCVYVNLFLNRCASPSCSIRKSLAYFAPDFDQICSFILRRRFQQQGSSSSSQKGSCTPEAGFALPASHQHCTAPQPNQVASICQCLFHIPQNNSTACENEVLYCWLNPFCFVQQFVFVLALIGRNV